MTGRYDALRDDGTHYVEGLRSAGIPAELLDYPMTHGVATPDITDRWLFDVVAHAAAFLAP